MGQDPLRALQHAMGDAFDRLPRQALEGRLRALIRAGRDLCPAPALADETFLSHLGRKLAAVADPAEALERLHGPDLFLACACASGDSTAVARLETLVGRLDNTLRRIGLATAAIEEAKQRLRDHLLVGGAAGPAILSYSARGPLQAWIRVAAVRIAIKLARSEQREVPLQDDALDLDDPELRYLKAHYRDAFRDALHQALAGLESRELNLIRLHYVDGLTTTQIGALYRVHQATASRWLERARGAILAGTRRALMEHLHVDRAEYESIMRLIGSRLDLTLRSFLS
jgi:RNA polymerase sigma-70 factor (ECF subfamily)